MGEKLSTEVVDRLEAQKKRQQLFDEGVYELSENEGFYCRDCDWRGLTAPMSEYTMYEVSNDGKPFCKCPVCDGDAYVKDSEVDHLAKFKEEYYVKD